jgi:dihydropteroate synthase
MGVLNVTPDSFSDGGLHVDEDRAVEAGLKLLEEGAEIIDVGGESTRPGAPPVSPEEESRRVIPVVRRLVREGSAIVSVDTTKAAVAAEALEAGATIVNDVSAGRFDPELLPLVAERGADIVLMHMQNTPRDMQEAPHYDDVVREVGAHLRERVAVALEAGVEPERIAVDPGIGFGKRLGHNLELLRSLAELRSLGLPIVLGVSRKSFLGALSGRDDAAQRDDETLAAAAVGHVNGADVHRVHDVAATRAALAVAHGLVPVPEEVS